MILGGAVPPETEVVALEESVGRAIAAPVLSTLALPPWDNAGMDGYAVRRTDVVFARAEDDATGVATTAAQSAAVTLTVIGTATAGVDPKALPHVRAGTAVRIMTGAPMPPGADAVIRIEDTDAGIDVVQVRDMRDATGRGNVRPRGEEIAPGDAVFTAGDTIGASHIGVLASLGCAQVLVHRQPRVTMLSGGDELVLLDRFAEVANGQRIVASSTYSLPVLLRAAGARVTVAPLVPDTLHAMVSAVQNAVASGCDLLVTTGGVSVGAHDYTRSAIEQAGGVVEFWRAKIRPGGPIGFGRIGNTTWLGLPGNPVSTMVTGALFAWPLIRQLGGHRVTSHFAVPVTMCDPYATPAPLTYFVRVTLHRRSDGGYDARLAGAQGSNLLRTMADAVALMMIPETVTQVEPGQQYEAVLLP